jgi:anti-sigma-K factor RskA
MTVDHGHDDARDLLGAYALNALDADERAAVDALLLRDAGARAELHELEHAAAWLGHAGLRPRAEAWDAISTEVRRDLEVPVVPAPPPNRGRRSPGWRFALAAAAAVLAILVVAGALLTLGDDSKRAPVAVRAERAADRPGARVVTMRAEDGTAGARVIVLPDGSGFVRGTALPPPGARRDFQLWSITPSGPVSAGVLPDGDKWRQFRLADFATALAVTNERAGGSAVPTGTPILSAELARA